MRNRFVPITPDDIKHDGVVIGHILSEYNHWLWTVHRHSDGVLVLWEHVNRNDPRNKEAKAHRIVTNTKLIEELDFFIPK